MKTARNAAPLLALALTLVGDGRAAAEVTGVEIERRELVLDGRPFGDAGAYEKLVGRIRYAFDPDSPANATIADLALAPRNANGLVEASGDLYVLQPVDPEKRSGTVLLEVSNRGGKAMLGYFQDARFAADPTSEEELGDGLLMERGVTLLWVGWQWDVPEEPGRLRLDVPIARGADGRAIEGLVRSDWVVLEETDELPLGHRGHVAHPAARPDDPQNVLTVRRGRLAPRRVVPREEWTFAGGGTAIAMPGGFEPGGIHELVYVSRDPRVVGLGLLAVRDAASYALHGDEAPFPAERAVAFGVSQTGRFLRHFLYEGLNTDERGRRVFDGMLAHSAGAGRGSFDHRFGQPSRDAHRYSAFFFPTDLFPFSGRVQRDPVTGERDGLLRRALSARNAPKVLFSNTGYEYWGRAGSLLHTSLDGSADVEPLAGERIYHLASAQHFRAPFPPRDRLEGTNVWRGNGLDLLVPLRALLVALLEWVEDGREPPPSTYPRIDEGTLVAVSEVDWPAIPGLDTPEVVHEAYRADYGPRWEHGIADVQPPELGPAFASLVPQVDAIGNDLGGAPTVETLVPLATYLPWSLRWGMPGEPHELADFWGTLAPLPRNAAERERTGDARPSVEELYASRAEYLEKVDAAARDLAQRRLLLPRDVDRVRARAEATWEWVTGER